MHALDRIDHQQRGRLHAPSVVRISRTEVGPPADRREASPSRFSAQADLAGRLAADINGKAATCATFALACKQGRFADPRIAAHQDRAARHQPPPSAVELGNAGAAPLQRLARHVQRLELIARPPLERSCLAEKTVAGASSASVFHSPQSAHCPCQRLVTATGRTDEATFGFGHGLRSWNKWERK
jgi:hypothetical protein